MKSIIEIGGIDGSGKSTLATRLSSELEKRGFSIYLPPSAVTLSHLFPRELGVRKSWYLTAGLEEIAGANIDGLCRRIALGLDSECDYVLLDRGYRTTKASIMARAMQRGYSSETAARLFEGVSGRYALHPVENKNILLTVNIDEAMRRNKQHGNNAFQQYVQHFADSLILEWKGDEGHVISSEKPADKVAREALEKILA